MNLRVYQTVDNEMYFDIDKLFKNPSVIPTELFTNKDPLLKLMFSTGNVDMHGNEIFQGDVVEFENMAHIMMRAVCEFGTVNRHLVGKHGFVNECEIKGFYFRLLDNVGTPSWATFPVVKNYQGISDYDLFEVIGNIYQNPELIEK